MKKNGFTVLESIVSFTLAATIGFFLLKITMIINRNRKEHKMPRFPGTRISFSIL